MLIGLGIGGCSQPLFPGHELSTSALAMFAPGPSSSGQQERIGNARLLEAFRSPEARVRVDALGAWAKGQGEEFPSPVRDLVRDPDAGVRAAAIQAIARRRPPGAERLLTVAVEDQALQVRMAAIAALGEVGGPKARAVLERSLTDRGELVRKAAVSALARLGAEELVLRAKEDPSWRVRLEVAKALGQYRDRSGADAAGRLLSDPSPEVQLQVLSSIGDWPLRQSGPILLEALGKDAYQTRRTATRQLSALWSPAAEFPVDGRLEQRKEALKGLHERFQREVGFVDPNVLAAPGRQSGAGRGVTVRPEDLAEVERLVEQLSDGGAPSATHDDALKRLEQLGPRLVGALEQLASQRQRALPEAIYRDLLARRDPAFAALERLQSEDVPARRQAAERLVELSRERPLGRLATMRLAEVVVRELDPLVWRSVLVAVGPDGSEPTIRLAYTAIGHRAAEVRRRACEHLAAHPSPSHAEVLLRALEDANPAVAGTAARALGALGRLEDTEPLKRLLGSANETLRVEAATALAQVGDPSGPAGLERLAYSRDPAIRRQVAIAMGKVGDPTFAPTLVRLLDDQYAIRLAALESLPNVAGYGPERSEIPSSSNLAEQIGFWKRAVRGRGPSAAGGRQ